MDKTIRTVWALTLAAGLASSGGNAFAASAGANFLRIGAGTRAAGMGSAFTATANDVSAVYWNPAGLARLASREAGATHAEWIAGTTFDHLAFAQPTRWGTWAAGLTRLSLGDLEGRGEDGSEQGSFSAGDTAVGLSFARPAFTGGQGGVTVKWIEQKIADEKATGFAADLGYRQPLGPRLTAGLAVRNLGPSMSFAGEDYSLPTTANLGLQWNVMGQWNLALDVEQGVKDGVTTVRGGTEYWVMDRVAIRAGYRGAAEAASGAETGSRLASGSGLHMGMGIKVGKTRIDYAVTPAGDFGESQQLSLAVAF